MYMTAGQQQSQTLSLAITTQAIQSIEILQFSQQELQEFLAAQAERNPLLEVTTPAPGEGPAPTRKPRDRGPRSGSAASGASLPDIAETHACQITLREHLHAQAALAFRTQRQRVLAAEIVEAIEPDGYLRRRTTEIAAQLGVEEAEVLAVLSTVQTFDPTGVGARTLGECLRLQLADRGELGPAMSVLLDNLALLANHQLDRLARLCRTDWAGVVAMVNALRRLDPSPGRRFDTDPVLPALPDILVDRDDAGGFTIELNPDVLPKVLVDRAYYVEVRALPMPDKDRRFVADCWRSANWLARHLDQRAHTVLKVAAEIVARQRGFLLHGIDHLRPLDLKTVAAAVGVHESTVCRAIANKYMMTPRGQFELKFFFAEGLGATNGEDSFATASVRHRIRAMIEDEDPEAVLSDDAIVTELERGGIEIARRTVAKYRAMMSIPSSAARRRQKRLLAAA